MTTCSTYHCRSLTSVRQRDVTRSTGLSGRHTPVSSTTPPTPIAACLSKYPLPSEMADKATKLQSRLRGWRRKADQKLVLLFTSDKGVFDWEAGGSPSASSYCTQKHLSSSAVFALTLAQSPPCYYVLYTRQSEV